MTIGIVTDSSCDLPPELVAKHDISVIPLFINIGNESYQDGIDISREDFYNQLPNFSPPPKTSTPGPEIFMETYQKLADSGITEIMSIHISRSLSAVLDSAVQAANEFVKIPVTVFDSRQLSLGTGFQALNAAIAAAAGKSMAEILTMLEDQISRTFSFAALSTLEFLKRSGRMNGAAFLLGNLLDIKPILRMYDGNPTSERIRTKNRAQQRMQEFLEKIGPMETAALMHSHVLEEAQSLLHQMKEFLPDGQKLCVEINPILGTHIGPGAIGFVCIARQKPDKLPW